MKLYLSQPGIICSLGQNFDEVKSSFQKFSPPVFEKIKLKSRDISMASGQALKDLPSLPSELSQFECRNNRLLFQSVQQISDQVNSLKKEFGSHRVGVILGSSTSGLDSTEKAFEEKLNTGCFPSDFSYTNQHEMQSCSNFVQQALGLKGPSITHSTACSSSAKVFADAESMIELGVCDAVVLGGSDALCQLTLNGFDSLSNLSSEKCLPLSKNRVGLNIGEGAALFILSKKPSSVTLKGCGESSDAHHMNAPHPEGIGAKASMQEALDHSQLSPEEISYINLHGTATELNDAMEVKACQELFDSTLTAISSTKPYTGHCLGAAAAVEAALCWILIDAFNTHQSVELPPQANDGVMDPLFEGANIVSQKANTFSDSKSFNIMSNSFAFGGSNCSIILGNN